MVAALEIIFAAIARFLIKGLGSRLMWVFTIFLVPVLRKMLLWLVTGVVGAFAVPLVVCGLLAAVTRWISSSVSSVLSGTLSGAVEPAGLGSAPPLSSTLVDLCTACWHWIGGEYIAAGVSYLAVCYMLSWWAQGVGASLGWLKGAAGLRFGKTDGKL